MIVVDTSLALQWLLDEPQTPRAEALLEGEPLGAPDILLVEAANVLGKKVRQGEIGIEQAQEGLRFIRANVGRLVSSSELVARALTLAVELAHPVYDCVFLACAEHLGGRLATRDAPFARRMAQRGMGALLLDGEADRT